MILEAKEREEEKKLTYPKAIFIIISTEFCERFSFFGMRTILALYIKNKLDFNDDASTIIFHTFAMLVFTFPLFGAILADSMLGKFRTIFYFSIIYSLGQLLLSASAVPTLGLPMREFSMIGLLLIAIGTAGIKPCAAAFGGEQFLLPEQQKYITTFFSLFCLAISAGSTISAFLTPQLRTGIKCFGEQDCYSAAFFIPTALMVVAIVIFVVGKPLYRMEKPKGNVALNVIRCISHAVYNKLKSNGIVNREHWLDHADDKYDSKLIFDVKEVLYVLKIFIPVPLFFALVDQQGSRWTFQATRMDGEIGNYLVKADQMQVIPALLVIILIPLVDRCVYPLFAKIGCLNTQLKKITTGGVLASVAFVISALVELKLEATYPIHPTNGLAQVRIFNPRDCHLPIVINNKFLVMEPFGIWEDSSITAKGNQSIPYMADFSQCGGEKKSEGLITAVEGQATSYVLEPSNPYSYKDYVNKTSSGNPAVRVLIYNLLNSNATTKVELSGVNYAFKINGTTSDIPQVTPVAEFNPGTYRVKVDGKFVDSIVLKLGGVYTLQTHVTTNGTRLGLTTVTPPNSVHILWLLPQYIVITIGEVLFGVTGLEFAFTQAPVSMKSIVQAAWLLTVAFGNLIVVIIAKAKIFDRQASEFLFFAGLMAVDMMILAIMAKFYRYRNLDNTQAIGREDSDTALEETDDRGKRTPIDAGENIRLWSFNRETNH
ncbi:peptide transporter family 1 [Diachasma alloeum]|uniref:peptide transporter family 1 n=1 Tax=Diachasma alloeum TaxID=454923 RepID=UPI0007383C43|nr:peptide transporter family 1 [Diachasma alloeum]